MRTDEDIKRDVEYELMWDPDIDPSDIGVAVKDGAVTLSGFARSFRQRRKAEEDATRVRGVRGVANDVEVRLPLINKRPDPEIVREIIAELNAELPYAAEDIKAVVRDGHVTLKGEVEWDYQRRRAADHTEGFTFAVALIQPASPSSSASGRKVSLAGQTSKLLSLHVVSTAQWTHPAPFARDTLYAQCIACHVSAGTQAITLEASTLHAALP